MAVSQGIAEPSPGAASVDGHPPGSEPADDLAEDPDDAHDHDDLGRAAKDPQGDRD